MKNLNDINKQVQRVYRLKQKRKEITEELRELNLSLSMSLPYKETLIVGDFKVRSTCRKSGGWFSKKDLVDEYGEDVLRLERKSENYVVTIDKLKK